jgi:hypothetical protein
MWQPIKPKPDVRDLNRPADPGDMWEDRVFAKCLNVPDKPKREKPRARVSLTPAMRALLVNLRKRAGMSGDDVARATGHTQSWIAHIELGNVETIDEDEFDRLLMLYNTEIQG